jgi:2-hydroxychromene-2-carboxylate isomerase
MPGAEFHFDFGSPNAYLAHLAIPQIEARTGTTFSYVPVLLGGVFKATNNVSPVVAFKDVRNKLEYRRLETARWLKHYGIAPVTPNPHFPVNTLQMMRGAVFAQRAGCFEHYVDVMFGRMWRNAAKMDDVDVFTTCLRSSTLPVDEILAGISDPSVKQELIANTQTSVARGTFGSPTFYVGNEIYFGKDSLRDVEASLAGI